MLCHREHSDGLGGLIHETDLGRIIGNRRARGDLSAIERIIVSTFAVRDVAVVGIERDHRRSSCIVAAQQVLTTLVPPVRPDQSNWLMEVSVGAIPGSRFDSG